MPRKINEKCARCIKLTAAEARQVHGPSGDGCWCDDLCSRIRSHYRHRLEINEKRRLAYQKQTGAAALAEHQAETVVLPVPGETSVPYANLYIWRAKRKDAPIHAIAASVFQNGSKVLEVEPIHCAGYRKKQLAKYVQGYIMDYLKARFGITFFAEEIRLEPIECRIDGCPYHDRLESAEVGDE